MISEKSLKCILDEFNNIKMYDWKKKIDVEHNAAGLPKKKLFLNEYPRLDTLWFSFHFLFGTREFNEKNTKNTEVCEWTELTKLISFQVVSSSYFTF